MDQEILFRAENNIKKFATDTENIKFTQYWNDEIVVPSNYIDV